MTEFMRIMEARVAGGVSDTSDEQVLRLKLDEARETLNADLEAERTALAELAAMSAYPLDHVTGVADVPMFPAGVQPLDVLRARAEMERDVAETKIERAGFLPSLTAGGTASNVSTDLGVTVETDNLIGLGTGAALGAIEADKKAAAARIEQAQEDSDRKIARLREYLASLDRQSANTGQLARQSVSNYRTFQEQYEAGQRQVMDVVNVYETMVSRRLEHVGLKYDAILTKLQMAEEFGLLVDGDDV
jgi:adhesin transport system outer membrane protein